MNTWLQKDNNKLITYKTPHRAFFKPPFDFEHFAQMDFALVRQPLENSIEDINAEDNSPFESDHRPLAMTCSPKLAKNEKMEVENTQKI